MMKQEEDTFLTDGDDSSDEEDSKVRLKNYDIETAYNEYSDKIQQEVAYLAHFVKEDGDPDYCFITNALGIKLLLHSDVNNAYYKRKSDKKLHNVIEFNDNDADEDQILAEWIKNAIEKTIKKVLNSNGKGVIAKILLETSESIIQKIINDLLIHKRLLFLQLRSNESNHKTSQLFEPLDQFCKEFDETRASPFRLNKFVRNSLVEATKAYIVNYINNNQLSNQGKLLNSKDKTLRIEALYDEATSFDREILDKLRPARGSTRIVNIATKYKKALAEIRIRQSLEDAKEEELVDEDNDGYFFIESEIPDDSALYWLYEADAEFVAKYLQIGIDDDFKNKFLEKFLVEFPKQLQAIKKDHAIHLSRGRLKPQHQFSSKTVQEFFANLRLSYLDELRQIRNAKELAEDKYAVVKSKKSQRSWQLGERETALEDQEATKNGARKDLVINLSNYEGVYDELALLKSKINRYLKDHELQEIDDSDFARWMKEILLHAEVDGLYYADGKRKLNIPRHLSKSLEDFFVNFVYLIVGCEGQRAPSSLIVIPMALELIEKGKLSWKKALNKEKKVGQGVIGSHSRHIPYGGGEIPMTMGKYENENVNEEDNVKKKKLKSEVVPCMRTLQQHYGLFTPKKWSYPGDILNENNQQDQRKVGELVRRHNKIVTKWFKHCNPQKSRATVQERSEAIETFANNFYKMTLK
jgi:hypothetical protein